MLLTRQVTAVIFWTVELLVTRDTLVVLVGGLEEVRASLVVGGEMAMGGEDGVARGALEKLCTLLGLA